ncbi:MAG: metallophosphoesterase [Candidatus Thalassarchaeaceae archaeon]|nr:metallophosphoesterase [Candidatus Thalassarchaeaceae archaeon]
MNGRWRDISLSLASIGLFAGAEAKTKLMVMDDPFKVIEIAKNLGITGVLTEDILQNIVEQTDSTQNRPEEEQENSLDEMVPVLDGTGHATQQTATQGRVIAPINTAEPEPPSRPHNLPHFSLDDFPMVATEVDTELEVHFDITGNSTTEGKLSDMLSLFNNRLEKLKRILVQSGRLRNRPIDVSQVIRNQSRYSSNSNTATIVGLVNDVRYKGENLHFKIEDKSGDIFCVLRPPRAMDSSPEAKRRNTIAIAGLMNDDVVGVTGFINPGSRDMFLVDDIHLPPITTHRKRIAEENQAVSVAFISDIHVGSHTFLQSQWDKMVKWFHEDPLAKTIKYLVLSGDVVDGVGIYPNQDKELEIIDLYKQYEEMARLIELMPDWVETIILPGNHDAVRPAEPQPSLEPLIQQYFNSATFVGNPCDFSIHGVRTLAYHGVSIMDFVSSIRHVTFSEPEKAMAEMLERRHLAPSWRGKTPLSPEPEDHMVIETIPDIFVCGHVHGHYSGDYKGTNLIQSSTWQDQTGYMRMLGFQPKPCILTVVNLHTHKTATIPFA